MDENERKDINPEEIDNQTEKEASTAEVAKESIAKSTEKAPPSFSVPTKKPNLVPIISAIAAAVVVIAVVLVIVLGGSGNGSGSSLPEDNPNTSAICNHSFGNWNTTKPATCREEGKLIRTCSKCSKTEESTVSKTDIHSEVVDVAVSPTCTADGKTEGKHCSVCEKIIVPQTNINKLGHIEVVDVAIAATCTSDGKTEGKHCSRCNATIVAQTTVKKSGHTTIIDKAVEATCTKAGLTEGSHCSTCGTTLVDQVETSLKEHNTVNGVCSVCGFEEYTEALIFELSEDGQSYIVTGLSKEDEYVISIPSMYNGKPVTSIGYEAFNERAITIVKFGSNLTSIGEWAFRGCFQLGEIVLPDSIITIGEGAFAGCSGLYKVTMGNDVISIGKMAFYQCERLETINLSSSLTTIGVGAFADNMKLKEIVFPNSLTKIDEQAFVGCTSLEEITLPDNLEWIETYAFAECRSLKKITIGSSPLKICPRAFMECTSLTSLYIPGNVRYIDIQAFAYCTNLKEVTILKGLQSIGSAAFQGCTRLEYMELPFIGHTETQDQFIGWIFGITTWYKDNATYVPSSLKTINFTGTTIPTNALYGCNITVKRYCAADKHTVVTDKAKESTCSKTGLTEGSHCSTCNKVFVAQQTVATVAHSYIDNWCTVCNQIDPSAVYPILKNYIKNNGTEVSTNNYCLLLGTTQEGDFKYERKNYYNASSDTITLAVDVYYFEEYQWTISVEMSSVQSSYKWRYIDLGDAEMIGTFTASSFYGSMSYMPYTSTNIVSSQINDIRSMGVYFVDYMLSKMKSDYKDIGLQPKNFGFSNYK